VLLAYAVGVLVLVCMFYGSIPLWAWQVAGHITVILAVVATTVWGYGNRGGPRHFWRTFDALLFVVVLFMMNLRLVHYVNPHDVDRLADEVG
jgi:chromate transport protein ChrA